VASKGKIIITSNRDEQVIRPAIAPQKYTINNKELLFPKDPKAGGTWYAVDENANVLVLLNGAAEKHIMNSPYRRSRGLIVLDLIGSDSPIHSWTEIDLENVEPFTIVLYENQQLYQLRWNGEEKETISLDTSRAHIWSSSTLYPKEVREKRAEWFASYLYSKETVTEKDMLHFHQYTETGNCENGLVINRNDILKTLSITQTVIENNKLILYYSDLINKDETADSFKIA
jgi:uncharacterized protein with NRDE domain